MNTHDTEAIILATTDHGESDRLITVLTRTSGKLKGIAKGARRSQKRFVHSFEPLSLVALRYRESRSSSLVWMEACKLLNPHLVLREDLQRWGYAALLCEAIKEMVPERAGQEKVFTLLVEALGRLGEEKDPLNVVVLALFCLLDDLGYVLGLESCRSCRQPIVTAKRWKLNLAGGELLCLRHTPSAKGFLEVDLGTIMLLRQTRLVPQDQLWRLRLRPEVKLPLLQAEIDLVRHQLGRDLKSLTMLQQLAVL
jgi:DNA repair protein RecO (recombination protein O)